MIIYTIFVSVQLLKLCVVKDCFPQGKHNLIWSLSFERLSVPVRACGNGFLTNSILISTEGTHLKAQFEKIKKKC